MTDDSLPLNEQATANEDYEMISNNIIISDGQTFASINITILHVRLIPILMFLHHSILLSHILIPIFVFIPIPYLHPHLYSYSHFHPQSSSLFLSLSLFLFLSLSHFYSSCSFLSLIFFIFSLSNDSRMIFQN